MLRIRSFATLCILPACGCAPRAALDAPTPELTRAMLELARVTGKDTVYEIGSSGAVSREAVERLGARGTALSEAQALESDLSPASVIVLAGAPGSPDLASKLQRSTQPGTRIVSSGRALPGLPPDKSVKVGNSGREAFLWTVRGAETAPNLGPFVPTPMPVVERMLELAKVTKDDVVYDLGCGDGRVVVEAARRFGARGVGIEYDARLCGEARRRAADAGVESLVTIRHEDVTKSDFSDATVVMLYLLPRSNEILRPKIQALRPGTRVVAHDYTIGDWKPLELVTVHLDDAFEHVLRLWRVGD